jgi:cytosine/uracil/thiamine/allantoin permease
MEEREQSITCKISQIIWNIVLRRTAIIVALSKEKTMLIKVKSGYPILNRASFGIFGAWWPTFNRAVMAIVWNGVNAVQGGQCIYVMLHALTPRIAHIKNVMGTGSALDSGGMIGFGIFWILTCCFLVIPIPKVSEVQLPLTVLLLTLFC